MPYPQIVITGDSISQQSFKSGGYGAALTDEVSDLPVRCAAERRISNFLRFGLCPQYHGKLDVLNRGMGGWNSRQIVKLLKSDMDIRKDADIKLFIIHIGTNDSSIGALQSVSRLLGHIDDAFSLQSISDHRISTHQVLLDDYVNNLRESILYIRSTWPSSSTILLTPSTLDAPRIEAFDASLGIPEDLAHPRTPENAKKYAMGCVKLGQELDVPVVDVYALHTKALQEGKTLQDLFWDGLHYSPVGYSVRKQSDRQRFQTHPLTTSLLLFSQMINEEILRIIRTTLPDLSPVTMPDGFPFFATYANEHDPRAVKLAALCDEIKAKVDKENADKEKKASVNGVNGHGKEQVNGHSAGQSRATQIVEAAA